MKIIFSFVFLFASIAYSAGKPQPPTKEPARPSQPQFELEKGLLDSLYKGSVSESVTEIRPFSSGIEVSPQISYVNASRFLLSNNYWDVPYSSQVGGIPSFSLHIANPVAYWGGLIFSLKGSVGYSYKEATLSATNRQTGESTKAAMTLHWLPVSLGTHFEYHISGLQAVLPFLNLEGGAQWLYQSGKLDGIEQGFWVPFYQASFGLTLFSPNLSRDDWFGGINVGASIKNSFASQQNIQSWSMDVGLNLYL